MSMETELAKASLTLVEKRNPYNLNHKMTRDELQMLTPQFNWTAYLHVSGAIDIKELNVTEPKFFEATNAELDVEAGRLENLSALACGKSQSAISVVEIRGRGLQLQPQSSTRRDGAAAAMEEVCTVGGP